MLCGKVQSTVILLLVIPWCADSAFQRDPVATNVQTYKKVSTPQISDTELENAFTYSEGEVTNRSNFEKNLPSSGWIRPESHSVEARHQRFLAFQDRTAELDQSAAYFVGASVYLKRKFNLGKDAATFGLQAIQFPNGSKAANYSGKCKKMEIPPECDSNSKFRTADGSCNNLKNPNWGKALSCFGRFLPPDYADGVSDPRIAVDGKQLPNARNVSVQVHEAMVTQNGSYTNMVMMYGQFVTHDVTMGLMTRTWVEQHMLECCPPSQNQHPECLAITILRNNSDFFYKNNQTCMNFVRGALCDETCKLGPREQSTQVTHFIDNSNVYGSVSADTAFLRSNNSGLLRSQFLPNGEFLPDGSYPTTDQCTIVEKNLTCFTAGDKRVNENPGLTSLHNLWLRQHNRLARLIQAKNPKANDEDIFQRVRRIIIAQNQHIIYNELLPILLGPKYMTWFKLTSGGRSKYNNGQQPSITNEFMAAANRYGHALIQENFQRRTNESNFMKLDEVYLSPFILKQGEFDPIMEGLASQTGKRFDHTMVNAVTQLLYRQKEILSGMDLAALNIQRGREQGIQGYTKYLKYCFNWNVTSFKDLDEIMDPANRKNLENIYGNVADVDLFTGGLSEERISGAVLGPTFACIMSNQFNRLKFGDRFFYEHTGQHVSFSDKQLKEIRKTTFGQVICENCNTIKGLNRNIFKLGDANNAKISCSDIHKFDHTLF